MNKQHRNLWYAMENAITATSTTTIQTKKTHYALQLLYYNIIYLRFFYTNKFNIHCFFESWWCTRQELMPWPLKTLESKWIQNSWICLIYQQKSKIK